MNPALRVLGVEAQVRGMKKKEAVERFVEEKGFPRPRNVEWKKGTLRLDFPHPAPAAQFRFYTEELLAWLKKHFPEEKVKKLSING